MGKAGRTLAAVGATLAALFATAGACTVFNGLSTATGPPEAGPPVDSTPPPDDASPKDAPAADTGPPPTYLSLEQAARVCTLAASCPQITSSLNLSIGVPIDANNFSLCMTWAAGPIPASRQGFSLQQGILSCIADAGSCTTAGACSIYEFLSQTDPRYTGCAMSDSGNYCSDPETWVSCGEGFAYAVHCQVGDYAPGSACNVGQDANAECSLGPPDAGCPAEFTCIGTFEDYCNYDMHIRFNCLDVGDTCDYVEGGLLCGDQACSTSGAVTCQGNVVASCDGVQVSPFDCKDLGGTCASAQNAVYCARPTDTCTPLDSDINVCTGSNISVCVGGQKTTFDCGTIGKSCVAGVVPQTPHCG